MNIELSFEDHSILCAALKCYNQTIRTKRDEITFDREVYKILDDKLDKARMLEVKMERTINQP